MKLYKLSNLAMFFVAILFYMTSCSKSTPTTPSSATSKQFLEITVDSKVYKYDLQGVLMAGYLDVLCDSKKGFLNNIYDGDLDNRFTINTDLFHYTFDVDFKNVSPGNYTLVDVDYFKDYCNYTFSLNLKDKSLSNYRTTLLAGGKHNISSVNFLGSASGNNEYLIAGNFTASYKNSANATIPVSGSYQKIVSVTK
jgi:hypothetical protein